MTDPGVELAATEEIIRKGEAALAMLKTKRAKLLGLDGPHEMTMRDIARMIHEDECNLAHEDQCGWEYEEEWLRKGTVPGGKPAESVWELHGGRAHAYYLKQAQDRVKAAGVTPTQYVHALDITRKR